MPLACYSETAAWQRFFRAARCIQTRGATDIPQALQTAPPLQDIWRLACEEEAQLLHPPPCPSSGAAALSAPAPPPRLSHPSGLLVRLLAAQVLRHHQRYGDAATATPVDTGTARRDIDSAAALHTQHTQRNTPVAAQTAGSRRARQASDDPDELGDHHKRRRGPPPLERFLGLFSGRAAAGAGATLACIVAYMAWHLPAQLGGEGLVPISRSVLGALDAMLAQLKQAQEAGAALEPQAADTLGWCLLALEGVAAVTWGVPREQRCASSSAVKRPPCMFFVALRSTRGSSRSTVASTVTASSCIYAGVCRVPHPDVSCEEALPAHALATDLDWQHIASTTEAAALLCHGSAELAMPYCRALWLRLALLERHLDGSALEQASALWALVEAAVVRRHNAPCLLPTPLMLHISYGSCFVPDRVLVQVQSWCGQLQCQVLSCRSLRPLRARPTLLQTKRHCRNRTRRRTWCACTRQAPACSAAMRPAARRCAGLLRICPLSGQSMLQRKQVTLPSAACCICLYFLAPATAHLCY
jgi:hypothetical protein